MTKKCCTLLFDQALPLILLYRQERTQYDLTARAHSDKSPSEIYGAEHLLRVFGKFDVSGMSLESCVLFVEAQVMLALHYEYLFLQLLANRGFQMLAGVCVILNMCCCSVSCYAGRLMLFLVTTRTAATAFVAFLL